MDRSLEPSGLIEAVTEAWRAQSLNVVLWLALVVGFPRLLMVTFQWPGPFSPLMRVSTVVLYVCVAAIAVVRRAATQQRAWAFLLILYAVAALQLYRTGMVGSGRITLAVIPVYALLLAGFRSGWVALILGGVLYSALIRLVAWGVIGEHLEVRENPTDPDFWIMQGILLLGAAVMLLVLLSRFLALHTRAVEAEYQTSARLRDEIVTRTAAIDALDVAAQERRRLEEEIAQASEDERRRLGLELHDGLCQQLTAALLQCVAIENQQAMDRPAVGVSPPVSPCQPIRNHRADAPPSTSSLGKLRQLLEDSIGTAYEVARGLCPLDIGADSLGSALERLAQRTRELTGLLCEFRHRGDTTIGDQQTALHLYRIAQEAVANATRHARPQRIAITLRGMSGSLILEVEDDGAGMRPNQGTTGGMGMNIMAYRASILGGTLVAEPSPGGGTRIVCRMPRGSRGDEARWPANGLQPEPVPLPDSQEDAPDAQ